MSKKKKLYLAGGVVLVLILAIWGGVKSSGNKGVQVEAEKVSRIDLLTSKVTASGEIRAKRFVDLQAEVTGVITDLYVHEGDTVKKGDMLLQIDPIQNETEKDIADSQYKQAVMEVRNREIEIANTELQLERDKAALNQARAELEQKEADYERQRNSFRRKQKLHEEGLLSRDDYEIAQNALNSAESYLDIQKENLKQRENQIEVSVNNIDKMKLSLDTAKQTERQRKASLVRAQDSLEDATIKSPLDGVITSLTKETGERAVPGNFNNPEATIMTIADLSVIQAELKVDETEIVGLSLGDYAEVEVDALPDIVFKGNVTEIGNSPISGTSQQEAKDFKVVVTLEDPSPKLRPGMSCTSDITTDTREDALAIPIQALTIREVEVDEDGTYHEPALASIDDKSDDEDDSDSDDVPKEELEGVFVIKEDKRARFRPIKTGITGETDIEVLDNLEEGEEIITGNFQTLRTIEDGAYVTVINRKKSEEE
ncbi:MAG: efflux RND transporter periplasmic adaptor subunit [Acidobacteriota bacterium]